MSKTTAALEVAVAEVIANRAPSEQRPTARQRAATDRAFARILKLIAPRIRHFIRQYGLVAHWDDAEQCCAIAVHRAIEGYDPAKAQFTTFVNWQIRGELQSLRFRLMTDQRPSAKKVEATTVSLHSVLASAEGEESSLEAMLVDEDALELTEAGASDYLAKAAAASLIGALVQNSRSAAIEQLRRQQPKRARARAKVDGPRLKSALAGIDPAEIARIDQKLGLDRIVLETQLFGEAELHPQDPQLTRDRIRQISKRASRIMAEIAQSHPSFRVMADYGETVAAKRAPKAEPRLLPDPAAPENGTTRILEVDCLDGAGETAAATHSSMQRRDRPAPGLAA